MPLRTLLAVALAAFAMAALSAGLVLLFVATPDAQVGRVARGPHTQETCVAKFGSKSVENFGHCF